MPGARVKPFLANLVDSDLEEDTTELSVIAKPATTKTMPAAKKGRGRAAASANKVTKSTRRRSSGRIAATVAAKAEVIEVLTDKTNQQAVRPARKGDKAGGDGEDVGMLEEVVSEKPKPSRGRPPKSAQGHPPNPKGRKAQQKAVPQAEADISETKDSEAMDLDDDDEAHDQLEDLPAKGSSLSVSSQALPAVPSSARSQRHVVDPDMSDSSVRRRLGELTKKYDVLEGRYRQLQEVGTREAEKNFDRLKKQTDERAQTSRQLVAELKAELAEQKGVAKEGQQLRKTIAGHETTITELQKQVSVLSEGLAQSKKENKALQTKLAVSRSAEASNAIKGTLAGGKANGSAGQNGAANKAADAVHAAQLKEDLFSDLTGLIVTGVKFHDKEDIFDCLQTGRNGTLHFKLSIETEMTGDGYEEEQVTYRPQLDPSRDRNLMDLLPDYLVEEITFPRPHSAKFYTRVLKALTERPDED